MAKKRNRGPLLTAERARELLRYDPDSGLLFWRVRMVGGPRRGGIQPGTQAGTAYRGKWHNYVHVGVDQRIYLAHRVAWLIQTGDWPEALVDHKDRNGLNNRWDNLRQASCSQNGANSKRRGGRYPKGVIFQRGRFLARGRANNHIFDLGSYATADEAHAAYVKWAMETFGEFARAA